MRNRNRVLTRQQIEEALYGWGEEAESNTIGVYVHQLRKKFAPSLFVTVRGVGYQLGPEEQIVTQGGPDVFVPVAG
jgi:DNA-binding response OmpR family regulator